MISQTVSSPLERLLRYLDGLSCRAPAAELRERMVEAELTLEDLARWVRFCDGCYQRNLIRQGRCYQAFALCWKSGQRSTIHDHAQSACGVRVVTGTATETIFEPTPCGLIHPTRTNVMREGDVVVSQDADIHQISNYEPAGVDLVTLHIYMPGLDWVNVYSLDSPEVERRACTCSRLDA